MNKHIMMVAMDMDGTLLDAQGGISPRCAEALRRAQAQGVVTCVCSGRYPECAHIVVGQAGLDMPVIGGNGCHLWRMESGRGRTLAAHGMKRETAIALYDGLLSQGVTFVLFFDGHVVHSQAGETHWTVRRYGDIMTKRYGVRFDSGDAAARAALEKDSLLKYFVQDFRDDAHAARVRDMAMSIPDVYVTSSYANNLELMPLGFDKGAGLAEMAALYDIDMQNVMAMGDYDNDIPMLRRAGVGVAMGNATGSVKRCADIVADAHTDEGVAKVIEQYVLRQGVLSLPLGARL